MKNNRGKKNLIFILIILVISLVVFCLYYIIIEKENPFVNIIETITNDGTNDNYNGIYLVAEPLDKTYFVFNGCTVSQINNYILVKNDKYYVYRSSCMGTYFKDEGNTKDLTISVNETRDSYIIEYKGEKYKKDGLTKFIRPNNEIVSNLNEVEISSLQLMMDETEFEGNYYNIVDKPIKNNSTLHINLDVDAQELTLDDIKGRRTIYDYYIYDMKKMPRMYQYGQNIAIIERDDSFYQDKMFGYNLLYVNSSGIVYSLRDQFPISVDDVQLRYDTNSIFVKFDLPTREYIVLVGYDQKMCDDNYNKSKEDDILYYEFRVKHNFLSNTFEKPEFKKIGKRSEGCKYVESIIGGE